MSKEKRKGNREVKKPKAKPKPAPSATSAQRLVSPRPSDPKK